MKTKKVIYEVRCPHCKVTTFEKTLETEEDSENSYESSLQFGCPKCRTLITYVVKGKVLNKDVLFRNTK